MSLERIRLLVQRLRERVSAARPAGGSAPHYPLTAAAASELLESMLLTRYLDLAAHELRARGHGHYTICSSGHEANAVLGRLTTPRDPALLHYRSAAFQLERARQAPQAGSPEAPRDPVRDIALSLVAARDEPVSGGRHKVLGGRPLGIIPSTSTIASQLPRAVGLGVAIERLGRLPGTAHGDATAPDSVVVCSFGDASLNHSTAQGALNAASWVAHQRLTLPVLWVCEDNGLGISVRTPEGWVEQRLAATPHAAVFTARGWDLAETWQATLDAVRHCRTRRRPTILHLRCARLLGHAGSDVDTTYRAPDEIEAALALDPVASAAVQLVEHGVLTAEAVLALDRAAEARVAAARDGVVDAPRLTTRAEVAAALLPAPGAAPDADEAALVAGQAGPPTVGDAGVGMTLAQGINFALGEALDRDPGVLVFGEDVARKGGVYGVTKGLLGRGGPARVFNTLLDEQTILGMALGAGTLGLLPVPEIQYLAYLHNAEDQLRGEAATLPYFSRGAYQNPMVVRIAGLGYQRGFGGHFHNDNSLAVLRDIPGLRVGVPSRGDDAVAMYRAAFALARGGGRVVVMVEPIALYHTRDLVQEGDGGWLGAVPAGTPATAPHLEAATSPLLGAASSPAATSPLLGAASSPAATSPLLGPRVYHPERSDLLIVTYGNGVHLSLTAAHRLQAEGIGVRVMDLRWVVPLDHDAVAREVAGTGATLLVDECRQSGGPSEALAADLLERGVGRRVGRLTSADCFIPLGDAARLVLLSEDEIVERGRRLVRG